MAISYPYYPQPAARPPYVEQPQIKGRPVSSIDEVRAMSIDFDGSIFFFPDLANKKIYTKQINLDGTSTINVYELKDTPVLSNNYITREEFETVISQLKQKMAPQATTNEPTTPYKENLLNF